MLIWCAVASALFVPLIASAFSPLLAWRTPVYILAGFAGILGMGLMVAQPLLASGKLPWLNTRRARRIHGLTGAAIVVSVLVHVGALWVTSPPDVIDALFLASPTPFSIWGVIAMWALICAALLAMFRRRLRWLTWRRLHTFVTTVAVGCTILHVILIEGTMEPISKILLCVGVVFVTVKAQRDLRIWGR